MAETILVVDDEAQIRNTLRGVLSDEGFDVVEAENGRAALEMLAQQQPRLAIVDIWMPEVDGIELVQCMRSQAPAVPIIVISGHGTIETAVRAIQLGAYNFVEKPLSLDKTVIAVGNALKQRRLEQENRDLRARVESKQMLIGESASMRELRKQIRMAAPTHGRVLIFGENGTGKELVARSIHAQSLRKNGSFIEVNCAAIPEELIESELFGHVKGAFTGAVAARKGKFEAADGGTLFLDEVGDMSLKTQAKVLRVLQEQKVVAVGSAEAVNVDCRVIAATNKDLEREIAAGNFRDDLFFRLNVIPFHMPPLRERREDIPALVDHFIEDFCGEYGKRPKKASAEAMELLMAYPWPGNVRELKNVIERLVIMVASDDIGARDLPPPLRKGREEGPDGLGDFPSLASAREAYEKQYILKKLRDHEGNVSRTAEALQIERSHLYRKMKAYGIKQEP